MDDGKKLNGNEQMRRLQGRYLKWTAYGLMILLACILQSTPHLFTILGARPLLIVPVVISIAMFTGPVGGAAAGIAGGLLWDLYADRLLGFNALLLLILGCACGLLVHVLIRNNLLSAMLLIGGALLVQCLADWFFNHVLLGLDHPFYLLLHQVLPNMAYTLIVAPLLYGLTLLIARLLRRRE